jgi:hypothetical protein
MIDITTSMLESMIANLQQKKPMMGKIANTQPYSASLNAATKSLIGAPQETPAEIVKLQQALSVLSSDVGYGTGSFYDHNGNPHPDYWLAGVWAVASLNWPSGKDIARNWSKQSSRYDDDSFEKAWNSYNPLHQNAIGIGSLYKRLAELKFEQANHALAPLHKKRFNLLSTSELAAIPSATWIIKEILPEKGVAAIYGPSGSGKSFLVFDMMIAIAHQARWFGFRVTNKPVVYVGLEGKAGFKNRIAAWEIENNTTAPPNLKIVIDNFNLKTESEVIALASEIVAGKMGNGVIVIDTLNQASPGSDENSSVDMGININRLQLLQELTGGLVIIIYHTGKNINQGLRGHSSLKGALDANIEVSGTDKRSWLLEKVKDGKGGISFGFRLKIIELGKDSDGDPITSCVIEPDHSLIFTKPEPTGAAQKTALKAIKEKLKLSPKISIDDAIDAIKPSLTTVKPNQRSNRARVIIQALINGGYLQSALENDEGVIWAD